MVHHSLHLFSSSHLSQGNIQFHHSQRYVCSCQTGGRDTVISGEMFEDDRYEIGKLDRVFIVYEKLGILFEVSADIGDHSTCSKDKDQPYPWLSAILQDKQLLQILLPLCFYL